LPFELLALQHGGAPAPTKLTRIVCGPLVNVPAVIPKFSASRLSTILGRGTKLLSSSRGCFAYT
jgi:hypothetical protein